MMTATLETVKAPDNTKKTQIKSFAPGKRAGRPPRSGQPPSSGVVIPSVPAVPSLQASEEGTSPQHSSSTSTTTNNNTITSTPGLSKQRKKALPNIQREQQRLQETNSTSPLTNEKIDVNQPTAVDDDVPIETARSSARRRTCLVGLNNYIEPLYRDHPAHANAVSNSDSLRAMAGQKGRPPTHEEVKKGLQCVPSVSSSASQYVSPHIDSNALSSMPSHTSSTTPFSIMPNEPSVAFQTNSYSDIPNASHLSQTMMQMPMQTPLPPPINYMEPHFAYPHHLQHHHPHVSSSSTTGMYNLPPPSMALYAYDGQYYAMNSNFGPGLGFPAFPTTQLPLSGAYPDPNMQQYPRKHSSTLSEQRRRWSINEGYENLRLLIPFCHDDGKTSSVAKASVLTRAACYIQDLTKYAEQLRAALRDRDDCIKKVVVSSLGPQSSKYVAITSLLQAEAKALEVFSPMKLWAMETQDSLGPPAPLSPKISPKEKLDQLSTELAEAAEQLLKSPQKRRKITHEGTTSSHSSYSQQTPDCKAEQVMLQSPASLHVKFEAFTNNVKEQPADTPKYNIPALPLSVSPDLNASVKALIATVVPPTPDLPRHLEDSATPLVRSKSARDAPIVDAAVLEAGHSLRSLASRRVISEPVYTAGLTLAFTPRVAPTKLQQLLPISDVTAMAASNASSAPLSLTSSPSEVSNTVNSPEISRSVTSTAPVATTETIHNVTPRTTESLIHRGPEELTASDFHQSHPSISGLGFMNGVSSSTLPAYITWEEAKSYIEAIKTTMENQCQHPATFNIPSIPTYGTNIVESKRRVSKDLTGAGVDLSNMATLPTLTNLRVHTDSIRPLRKRRSGTPGSTGPVSAFPPIPATNALGISASDAAPPVIPEGAAELKHGHVKKASGISDAAADVATAEPVHQVLSSQSLRACRPHHQGGERVKASSDNAGFQVISDTSNSPEDPYLLPPVMPQTPGDRFRNSPGQLSASSAKVMMSQAACGLPLPHHRATWSSSAASGGFLNAQSPVPQFAQQTQHASILNPYQQQMGTFSQDQRPPLKRKHATMHHSDLTVAAGQPYQQMVTQTLLPARPPSSYLASDVETSPYPLMAAPAYAYAYAGYPSHAAYTGSSLAAQPVSAIYDASSTNAALVPVYSGSEQLLPEARARGEAESFVQRVASVGMAPPQDSCKQTCSDVDLQHTKMEAIDAMKASRPSQLPVSDEHLAYPTVFNQPSLSFHSHGETHSAVDLHHPLPVSANPVVLDV